MLTTKVQEAVFPAWSSKRYSTLVWPALNSSPGLLVDRIRLVLPELSTAVGAVKKTGTGAMPVRTLKVMSSWQVTSMGLTVSSAGKENKIMLVGDEKKPIITRKGDDLL